MNPTPYMQHKWAKEKWKYSCVHSMGKRTLEATLFPDSSPGMSQAVSVLLTFGSTKWNQLSLLCSFTQLFPHLFTKAQSPKLVQIQLAIRGVLQPNQSQYTVLLSDFQPDFVVTQQQKKKPQDLLLKTKVSSRVCRDFVPLSSPALDHKAQSLVLTVKPSNAMSIELDFNSHRVRMSVANRLTEKENFKKLKGKLNTKSSTKNFLASSCQ